MQTNQGRGQLGPLQAGIIFLMMATAILHSILLHSDPCSGNTLGSAAHTDGWRVILAAETYQP